MISRGRTSSCFSTSRPPTRAARACWRGCAGAPPHGTVFPHGGRRPTGRDALRWAREVEALGAGELLLTSMDRDGTGDGYDLLLTRAVSEAGSVRVIASGGAAP